MQSFSGGNPEPHGPKKTQLVLEDVAIEVRYSCAADRSTKDIADMRLWHLITALLRVQSWSSLLQVVALDPIDHKNTIYPHRSGYKGPLIIAPWPPKHWRYCRYETLTLNNSTPSCLIFQQSVSGGKPESKRPKKHNLAAQTLPLGSAIPCFVPPKAWAKLPIWDFYT